MPNDKTILHKRIKTNGIEKVLFFAEWYLDWAVSNTDKYSDRKTKQLTNGTVKIFLKLVFKTTWLRTVILLILRI